MPNSKSIRFRYKLFGFSFFLALMFWGLLCWALFVLIPILFDGARFIGLLMIIALVTALLVWSIYLVFWRLPWSVVFDSTNDTLTISTFTGTPRSYPLNTISHWKKRANKFFEWPSVVFYFSTGDYVVIPAPILDNRIHELMRELALPFDGEETRAFMGFRGKISRAS